MSIFDRFRKKTPALPEHREELEQLGYPFTLLPEELTNEVLMQYYRDARERGRKEGFTPVLLRADDHLGEFQEALEEFPPAQTTQAEWDGKAILDERLAILNEPEEEGGVPLLENKDPDILGTLENGEANHSLSLIDPFWGKCRIALVELPTEKPWEVPLYIPFGGWNECPLPEEHAAILKYWYEKWGAAPAAMTFDTIELVLPSPIPEAEVWDVAKEHFAYTEDSVFQGTGTLGALADGLRKSDVWFFWWD